MGSTHLDEYNSSGKLRIIEIAYYIDLKMSSFP